jgi:hypothetical protein
MIGHMILNVMIIPKRNDDMVWLKCRENSTKIIYIYIALLDSFNNP